MGTVAALGISEAWAVSAKRALKDDGSFLPFDLRQLRPERRMTGQGHSWERTEPGLEPRALSPSLLLAHPLHTETPQTSHIYTPYFTPMVAMSEEIFEEGEEGEEELEEAQKPNSVALLTHGEVSLPLCFQFSLFSLSMVEQVIIDS